MNDIVIEFHSSESGVLNLDLMQRVFDQVLRPAFIEDELPGQDYFLSGFKRGQEVAVATIGGSIVGAAVVDGANGDGIALLSYLAVTQDRQGAGIGGKLLDAFIDRWRRTGVNLVLGEVHDPRAHAESESEHPADRISFYARHGCEVLDIPWIQPALGSETNQVAGMLLVVMERQGAFAGDRIDTAPIRSWIRDYYADTQGRSHDGVVPDQLEARLASLSFIRVLPLEDFTEIELLD